MLYDIVSQVSGSMLAINLTRAEVNDWKLIHPNALVWVVEA